MNSAWFCLIWGDILQNKSLFWIFTLPVDNLQCLLTACLSLTCQRVTQAHSARWQMVTNANITLNWEHNSWQWPQYCWQLVLMLVLGWEFVGTPGLINSLCRCWRQTADTAPRDFGPYQRWHPTLQHHHHPSWVFTLGVWSCCANGRSTLQHKVPIQFACSPWDAPLSELGSSSSSSGSSRCSPIWAWLSGALCRFSIWQIRCWNIFSGKKKREKKHVAGMLCTLEKDYGGEAKKVIEGKFVE